MCVARVLTDWLTAVLVMGYLVGTQVVAEGS